MLSGSSSMDAAAIPSSPIAGSHASSASFSHSGLVASPAASASSSASTLEGYLEGKWLLASTRLALAKASAKASVLDTIASAQRWKEEKFRQAIGGAAVGQQQV